MLACFVFLPVLDTFVQVADNNLMHYYRIQYIVKIKEFQEKNTSCLYYLKVEDVTLAENAVCMID